MFTHLHTHTVYSLLDGANRIPELVSRAKELGQTSLAITDHGTMGGIVPFYDECHRQGIKPIIGCEVYVAPDGQLSNESSGTTILSCWQRTRKDTETYAGSSLMPS